MQCSNLYVLSFATVICVVCSVLVSSSYVGLKDKQDVNARLDKQKKILEAAGFLKIGESITLEEVKI